jgi:hypothetical protein
MLVKPQDDAVYMLCDCPCVHASQCELPFCVPLIDHGLDWTSLVRTDLCLHVQTQMHPRRIVAFYLLRNARTRQLKQKLLALLNYFDFMMRNVTQELNGQVS